MSEIRDPRGRGAAEDWNRAWIFIAYDLAEYVRSHYAYPRQALQVTVRKEHELCHSTNAEVRGGSISPRHQESALDALLKQAVKPNPGGARPAQSGKLARPKLGEKPKYTLDEAGYKWLNKTEHKRTYREDM